MSPNPAIASTERSPSALFEACARDDTDAITEFVRRYQPELAGYARRHNAEDPEGAADLATFDTVRRLADMRRLDEPAVRAYLYRALKRRLIDERRATVPQVSIEDEPLDLIEDGPEHPVLDRMGLTELLDVLTPAEREVVSHRFVAGYTSVETAERVGRSPDAVRRLQSNALARLRLALAVAVTVAAIGTGYWWLRASPPVRMTDPIDDGIEQDAPAPGPPAEDTLSGPTPTPLPADPPTVRASGRVAVAPAIADDRRPEATDTTELESEPGPEASTTTALPALAEASLADWTPTSALNLATNAPTTAPPSTTAPSTTAPSTTAPSTTRPISTTSVTASTTSSTTVRPNGRPRARDRRGPNGRPRRDDNRGPNRRSGRGT